MTQLSTPNDAYVVLRSIEKSDEKYLYLSSDAAGEMKLKTSLVDIPGNPEVDPALLFRVVN